MADPILKQSSFEIDATGVGNGTTISTANSGSPVGNAFDTVQIGATCTLVYSTTQKLTGLYGAAVTTGGTAGNCNLQWTLAGINTVCFRAWVFTPSSFALTPSIFRAQGSATQAFRMAWDASGHLVIRNTANTAVQTSTATMSTSTAYRVEGYGTIGASSTASAAFYVGNSTTPVEVVNATAANFGTNTIDNVAFGQVAAITSMPTWYLDTIAVGNIAQFLGPFVIRANFNKVGRRVTYIKASGKRRPAIVTGVAADGNPILRVRHGGETYGTSAIGVPPRTTTANNFGNVYLTW